MFSRLSSTLRSSGRTLFQQSRARMIKNHNQRRNMGGGSHWMEQSQVHTQLGEVFGFVCWMWIFYRAREDLPVVLGWRHPWEHAEDPWAGVDGNVPEEHVEGIEELRADWDTFMEKAKVPGDGDDDEDDDDDEDEDDDEDDEE